MSPETTPCLAVVRAISVHTLMRRRGKADSSEDLPSCPPSPFPLSPPTSASAAGGEQGATEMPRVNSSKARDGRLARSAEGGGGREKEEARQRERRETEAARRALK